MRRCLIAALPAGTLIVTSTAARVPVRPRPLEVVDTGDFLAQFSARVIPGARVLDDRPRSDRVGGMKSLVRRENGGGTGRHDNGYAHARQLEGGSSVLTKDTFRNPAADLGMNGQLLRVTP